MVYIIPECWEELCDDYVPDIKVNDVFVSKPLINNCKGLLKSTDSSSSNSKMVDVLDISKPFILPINISKRTRFNELVFSYGPLKWFENEEIQKQFCELDTREKQDLSRFINVIFNKIL